MSVHMVFQGGVGIQPKAETPMIATIEGSTEYGNIDVEAWELEKDGEAFRGITLHQKGQMYVPDAITLHFDDIPNMVEKLNRCYQAYIRKYGNES